MTTLLLTGFEPFGGDASNSSGEAVRLAHDRWTGPAVLIAEVLPVTFAGATRRMRELIDEHEPDVVIAAGLAGGRAAVTPERVAINLADARIPDNAGAQPSDEPIVAGAPAAYFATLPAKAIAAAVADAGIAASTSHTAGTFVCNAVMYTALHATAGTMTRAVFVHVPYADGSAPAGLPSLPLSDLARALEVALLTVLDDPDDTGLPGGSLS